jgi:enoyl-CoA hydratase/carnithine racemase
MSNAATGPVQLEFADGIATVTLDRHERRNAIGTELATAFKVAAGQIADAGVTVAVLRANGTSFSAGADLGERLIPGQPGSTDVMLEALAATPVLWIAQVQGGCVGAGVSLALSCPIVIASTDAWLWVPELSKLGHLPLGVLRRTIPTIGVRAALGLAATERRVSATEAFGFGWFAQLVPPEDLAGTTDRIARRLAGGDTAATRAVIDHWRGMSAETAGLATANVRTSDPAAAPW